MTGNAISEQNASKASTFMPTAERLKTRKGGANYQDGVKDYDELMLRLK